MACKRDRLDLVQKLLGEPSFVDPSFDNNRALECCCENGRDKIAELLLTYPAVSFEGNSALELAKKYKNDRCIALASRVEQSK
ncbi:Hypothetical protein POVR2_LOCUS19 [uncultured virus]|nr:Hypothetical protein POVR2_LOCUS19 [uncultured virus]